MHKKIPKNQTFSLGAVKLIQEICQPLKSKGLVHFTHDITFGQRQISLLMNDRNALMFYFHHKMPAICVDETGRTFDDGTYLGKVLREYYQDAANIFPRLPFMQNSIHICKRETDRQQLYSFYFGLEENEFLHWVLNNGNLLTDFIDGYHIKAQDTLLEAYEPDNRTILPLFKDVAHQFTEPSKPFQIKIIHKYTHQSTALASQQSICLLLLSQGKSTKEIATNMKLSRRTIEHYLERIRKILGCRTNQELIAFYGEQLSKIIF